MIKTDEINAAEYRMKTNSGQYEWFRTRAKALEMDEAGTPTHAFTITQNIDKEKKEFQKKEQAEEADIMNRLGKMLTHEIRNPVTNISLATEMLKEQLQKLPLLALLYLYFNVNEYLIPAFKMKKPEEAHLTNLFGGEFAPLFWFAILVGMIIPIIIMLFRAGRKPFPMFIAGIMVVVGA